MAVADSANLDIVRAIAVMLVFISHVPTEAAQVHGVHLAGQQTLPRFTARS